MRDAYPSASPAALEVAEDLAAHAPALLPLVLADATLAEDVLQRPLERADDDPRSKWSRLVVDMQDGPELHRFLRRARHRAMVRIALREVRGLADIDETSAELADLAGAALDAALIVCRRSLAKAKGDALGADGKPLPLVVLGMGKLGGHELNPGSDVDICFFYETDQGTTESGISPHEFFTRLVRRTSSAIGEVTEDGFVFRVDLRLRPEGSRGPLANSLRSAERYYQDFGRTWERAALLRASPVAGDLELGARLLNSLEPFVYRRKVDPEVARAMHEMVLRSRQELSSAPERDVKLGRGGIREAEFFVQGLQLVWGGRHPEVRSAATVDGARRLCAAGFLTQSDLGALESAWALLRRVEHRIHLHTGYQTHDLPDDDGFAHSLGFDSHESLEAALDDAKAPISRLFDSLVADEVPAEKDPLEPLLASCADGATRDELEPLVLRYLPMRDESEAAAHLHRLARTANGPLGPLARARYPRLGARLMQEVADAADPDLALRGLAGFFSRGGAGYARWLVDDPRLMRRLVGLLGASPTLGAALLGRTDALDAVFSAGSPSNEELLTLHAAPPDQLVPWLRRLKRESTLRIGLAHVAGELDVAAATALLTALANAQVNAALQRSRQTVLARRGADTRALVVVGMGKLGGNELGFGSDLDLVFLHDEGEPDTMTRIAQRTMRILSRLDSEGPGYETDTRLRPSGSHGTLVRSLSGFMKYHQDHAEGWERQALVRARVVSGTHPEFTLQVESTIESIAYRGPPQAERVAELRGRMQRELAAERPHRYHPKLGFGALVDVEFTTQWLQMLHGSEPRVRQRNTRHALKALKTCLPELSRDVDALLDAQRFFRDVEQAVRLLDPGGDGGLTLGGPRATAVTRRLGLRARDGQRAEEVLELTWRALAEETRGIFERTIGPVKAHAPWGPR